MIISIKNCSYKQKEGLLLKIKKILFKDWAVDRLHFWKIKKNSWIIKIRVSNRKKWEERGNLVPSQQTIRIRIRFPWKTRYYKIILLILNLMIKKASQAH